MNKEIRKTYTKRKKTNTTHITNTVTIQVAQSGQPLSGEKKYINIQYKSVFK
jgi:hypothetical protein